MVINIKLIIMLTPHHKSTCMIASETQLQPKSTSPIIMENTSFRKSTKQWLVRNYTAHIPANPLPNSNPLDAGKDKQALASSASSLSKTGEPSPWHKREFTNISPFFTIQAKHPSTLWSLKNHSRGKLNSYTWDISCNAGQNPTNRIPFHSNFINGLYHLLSIFRIWTPYHIAFNLEEKKIKYRNLGTRRTRQHIK